MSRIQRITTDANTLKLQHVAVETTPKTDFGKLLQKEISRGASNVQFSKHAAQRVRERGIDMNENLLQDLNQAVLKARAKGARDVVVIGSQEAFIVNIPNNVVVTTMNESEMKNNIFTNIDSAVLM